MRPGANFTFHAILVACLAALAAASAAFAAPSGDAVGAARFSLTIDGVEIAKGDNASVNRQDFDFTGYRFGPTRTAGSWAKVDGLNVSWDVPDQRAGYYGPANTKYPSVKLSRADGSAPAGRVTGIATDPSEPASGKRMHKPAAVTRPLDRGSIAVRGNFPDCAVGKRYAGAQFAGGGMQYQLEDLVIADCGNGAAILNYAKVKVRGWDPEKKE
jgi:hypothetical protein